MTKSNYAACLASVLKWEGGYVDHPKDPGGATNYGITQGTLSMHRGSRVSKQDVRNLTLDEAGEIYRPRYWNAVQGDHLPDGFDLIAFDGGVNSGPSRGARWLQRGLGVKADGKVGPATLTAATLAEDGVGVIQRASKARMGFLRGLKTWSTFGRGWARRVADTEATAVAMNTKSRLRLLREASGADKAKKAQNKGSVTSVFGGASSGLADLPEWVVGGLILIAVTLAVLMVLRALQHGRRATAYRAKAEEMEDE